MAKQNDWKKLLSNHQIQIREKDSTQVNKRSFRILNQQGDALLELTLWIFILGLFLTFFGVIHHEFENANLRQLQKFQNEWNKKSALFIQSSSSSDANE